MKILFIIFAFCCISNKMFAQRFGIKSPNRIAQIESLSTSILNAWPQDTIQKFTSDSIDLTLIKVSACLNLGIHQLGYAVREDKTKKELVYFFFFERELIQIEIFNDDIQKRYFYHWKEIGNKSTRLSSGLLASARDFAVKLYSKK